MGVFRIKHVIFDWCSRHFLAYLASMVVGLIISCWIAQAPDRWGGFQGAYRRHVVHGAYEGNIGVAVRRQHSASRTVYIATLSPWRAVTDPVVSSSMQEKWLEAHAPWWVVVPPVPMATGKTASEVATLAAGFPFRAVKFTESSEEGFASRSISDELGYMAEVKLGTSMIRIAYGIMPFGVLANGVVYLGLGIAIHSLWKLDRQSRRQLNGMCGYCAYVLIGLPEDSVCPECGRHPGVWTRVELMAARLSKKDSSD